MDGTEVARKPVEQITPWAMSTAVGQPGSHTCLIMAWMRSLSQGELSLMLMKPGPARVGLPSMAGDCGSAFTIAVATSLGFLGAPSCKEVFSTVVLS